MPYYKDGMAALTQYIKKNIKYPLEALKDGLTGHNVVQLIIDTNGIVSVPKIIHSSGNKGMDEETVRLFNKMPNWIPGITKSKKVKSCVNIIVSYKNVENIEKPLNIEGLNLISEDIDKSNQFDKFYKDSISKANKANLYYFQSLLLSDIQKYKEAIAKLNFSLLYCPSFMDALYNKAVIHFKLNEKEQGCETLKKLYFIDKKDEDVKSLYRKYCSN